MDQKDPYYKIRQTIESAFQSVPATIILGSGASAAFGIPSMEALAEKIIQTVGKTVEKNDAVWSKFKESLESTKNLESALETIERTDPQSEYIKRIAEVAWAAINDADRRVYEKVLSGALKLPLERLLFSVLRGNQHPPSIVTTNYDKLGEYAVDCLNVRPYTKVMHYTGFMHGCIRHMDAELFANTVRARTSAAYATNSIKQVNIWKVHGSIDWFKNKAGEIVSAQNYVEPSAELSPTIITPGIEKYRRTSSEPYRTIIAEADNAISQAGSYFAIGFGFRDQHIQEKLVNNLKKKNITTIVITKALTQETKDIFTKGHTSNAILLEESGKGAHAIIVNKSSQGGVVEETYPDPIWNLETFANIFMNDGG